MNKGNENKIMRIVSNTYGIENASYLDTAYNEIAKEYKKKEQK